MCVDFDSFKQSFASHSTSLRIIHMWMEKTYTEVEHVATKSGSNFIFVKVLSLLGSSCLFSKSCDRQTESANLKEDNKHEGGMCYGWFNSFPSKQNKFSKKLACDLAKKCFNFGFSLNTPIPLCTKHHSISLFDRKVVLWLSSVPLSYFKGARPFLHLKFRRKNTFMTLPQ